MLLETTAVCAEFAAKEELMTLNAVDRLIESSQAHSASRLQSVQNVENVGAGLKHFGVGLVGALGLDHLGQLRRQVDRRAFERRGFDRAEARAAGGPEVDGAGRSAWQEGVAVDGDEIV